MNAPQVAPKRPFAITLALLVSLWFGFVASQNGCNTIAVYRAGLSGPSLERLDFNDAEQRAAVVAAHAVVNEQAERLKPKAFPLAVADMVLGTALLMFAFSAMSRSAAARRYVMQLVAVHSLVSIGSGWALRDLKKAEIELFTVDWRAHQLERAESDEERAAIDNGYATMRRVGPASQVAGVALRVGLGGLVLLVLSRKRTRDYFESDLSRSGADG